MNRESRSDRSEFDIHRSRFRRALRSVGVIALMGTAAGCTDAAGYDLDILLGRVPFFSYMRESVSPAPYEMPRLPAEGSVPAVNPRGNVPPPFTQTDLVGRAAVVEGLQNPLEPTAAVLARGGQLYQQHCWACHGDQGVGNGPVVGPGKFPYAPASNAAAVAQYSDGYLYGIIRVGRGLMPAYGDRTGHLDRWAMVLYMRQLGAQPGIMVPANMPISPAGAAPAEGLPPGAVPQQPVDAGVPGTR